MNLCAYNRGTLLLPSSWTIISSCWSLQVRWMRKWLIHGYPVSLPTSRQLQIWMRKLSSRLLAFILKPLLRLVEMLSWSSPIWWWIGSPFIPWPLPPILSRLGTISARPCETTLIHWGIDKTWCLDGCSFDNRMVSQCRITSTSFSSSISTSTSMIQKGYLYPNFIMVYSLCFKRTWALLQYHLGQCLSTGSCCWAQSVSLASISSILPYSFFLFQPCVTHLSQILTLVYLPPFSFSLLCWVSGTQESTSY